MFRRTLLSFALVVLTAGLAMADIPGPGRRVREPRPLPEKVALRQTAPVVVNHADLSKEGKGVTAKIVIPSKFVAGGLRPGLGGPPPTSSERESSLPWWTTVIAGGALSAAAVALLLVVRNQRSLRIAATGAAVVAVFAGGYALADLRVPDEEPAPKEMVIIEVVPDGDAVTITLPKAGK